MSAPFVGQVAIVTGGAGGIGLATAQQLAKNGVKVALVDMQQAALDKAQATLCAAVPGAMCLTIAADVADTAAADSAVRGVMMRWGRLDILVRHVHNTASRSERRVARGVITCCVVVIGRGASRVIARSADAPAV